MIKIPPEEETESILNLLVCALKISFGLWEWISPPSIGFPMGLFLVLLALPYPLDI